MAQVSAGILLYRLRGECPEVFLIHMGGPFWARKDLEKAKGTFVATVPSHDVVMVKITQ